MKKKEIIERYGEEAYQKVLEQAKAWKAMHPEQAKASKAAWDAAHPEKVKAASAEQNRAGGKRYAKKLKDDQTGIRGVKQPIRYKHNHLYKPLKNLVDPTGELTQIHHEWKPNSAEYSAVAIVEKNAHQYGIIKPIQILNGKITLLTEKEIREQ